VSAGSSSEASWPASKLRPPGWDFGLAPASSSRRPIFTPCPKDGYTMHPDVLALDQPDIRGADSNSLLRMYDEAKAIAAQSPSQLQRNRADRAVRRLARELQKRCIPCEPRPGAEATYGAT